MRPAAAGCHDQSSRLSCTTMTVAMREERQPCPWTCPGSDDTGLLGSWLFDFAGYGWCLGLLVLSRGDHAERGVAAVAVVEGLDVLEHGGLQLEPRRPAAAVCAWSPDGTKISFVRGAFG